MKGKKGSKYALGIILNFVWMFVLYRGCIFWTESAQTMIPYGICAAVYLVAVSVLMVLYFYTGDPNKPETRNKGLLMWAFPILVCLILDVLDIIVIGYIIDLFNK